MTLRRRPDRPGALPLLALLVVALVGCAGQAATSATGSSPATEPARSYVATVQGTDALLGIVVTGGRALAYLCDGLPAEDGGRPATVATWFNVATDGTTVTAQNPNGALDLQIGDAGVSGTVTLPDGQTAAVTGTAVNGDAGLYRGESESGPQAVAGWIVAANGSQRGTVAFEGGGGLGFDPGGGIKPNPDSGVSRLNPAINRVTLANQVTLRVAKVGITPIPIP